MKVLRVFFGQPFSCENSEHLICYDIYRTKGSKAL